MKGIILLFLYLTVALAVTTFTIPTTTADSSKFKVDFRLTNPTSITVDMIWGQPEPAIDVSPQSFTATLYEKNNPSNVIISPTSGTVTYGSTFSLSETTGLVMNTNYTF